MFIFAGLLIMIRCEDVLSSGLNRQQDHKNTMEIDINININLDNGTESELLTPKARALGSKAQSQSGRVLSNIINRKSIQIYHCKN